MLSISPCLVDVNADGTASPRDALHVANTIESGGYVAGADVNSDGEVSSDDFDLVVEGVTASASEGSGGDDSMGHRDPGIDAFIDARRGDKVARIPERLLGKEVGCGSGQAMAGSSGSGSIDLKIWRGANQGEEVPSNQEDTVGSFVVANLNDTDADGTKDAIDLNGVPGGDEDMMRIQIPRPPNYDGSDITLWTIWWEETPLWSSRVGKASDHIPWDANGEYTFTFQSGENAKTFFVSSDVPSAAVRDIIIVASYLDASDSVLATAVWAELVEHKTQSDSNWLRLPAASGATSLSLANASIFSVGNQLLIYDSKAINGNWSVRESRLITAINGNNVTVSPGLSNAYPTFSHVRVGLSAPLINESEMLDVWIDGGASVNNAGVFGSDHDAPNVKNGNQMKFVLYPPGIRSETVNTIMIDVTRQIEAKTKHLKNGQWENVISEKVWPSGDSPNDDGSGHRDNDNTPIKTGPYAHDYVFSADQPGFPNPVGAGVTRAVQRLNGREFVRVKLAKLDWIDNQFANGGTFVQGSRMSDKFEWHSQVDAIPSGLNPNWFMRNALGENSIGDGHIDLDLNSPW